MTSRRALALLAAAVLVTIALVWSWFNTRGFGAVSPENVRNIAPAFAIGQGLVWVAVATALPRVGGGHDSRCLRGLRGLIDVAGTLWASRAGRLRCAGCGEELHGRTLRVSTALRSVGLLALCFGLAFIAARTGDRAWRTLVVASVFGSMWVAIFAAVAPVLRGLQPRGAA